MLNIVVLHGILEKNETESEDILSNSRNYYITMIT